MNAAPNFTIAAVDCAEVRRFCEIIHAAAAAAFEGAPDPGWLQLSRVHPAAGGLVIVGRYAIGEHERMAADAVMEAENGHNLYVEGRTIRRNLPGRERGGKDATAGVFALVVDSDGDKGKAGKLLLEPSLTVESSPGNAHHWYILNRAISWEEADAIGAGMRAATGADSDTGNLCQPYRVAGTPNYPNAKKQARGRINTPTRIISEGDVYSAEDLVNVFGRSSRQQGHEEAAGGFDLAELLARCPANLRRSLADENVPVGKRSEAFHRLCKELKEAGFKVFEAVALIEAHPRSAWCAKYKRRVAEEVMRCWGKPDTRQKREQEGADEVLFTEDRVARVFAAQHAGKLRYDHDRGRWFSWAGTHWHLDKVEDAFQRVRDLAVSMGQAEGRTKEASRLNFARHVAEFARGDRQIAVTSDGWDVDPWLLGTPGGTVDLRTGLLRPAEPGEGITLLTSVAPASEAACPRWLQFIDEVTRGEPGYGRFLQQMAGYALTGITREHALFFTHGAGQNGKSVFINTMTYVLQDYATTASMETFIASTHDRHPTELARLRGARLVTASETEEGRAWAEARIKALTGGDRIAARFMARDFFEFTPTFKLLIIGNFAPVLRNVDEAARRRFNLLPFNFAPPEKDVLLEEKLRAEAPGILRWAIDGCLDWQANGLLRPDVVKAATEDYFEQQDMFGQFLDEECDVDPGNQWKTAPSGKLFKTWHDFATSRGENPGSQKAFSGVLQKRGLVTKRGTGGVRTVIGVRLNADFGGARD